MNNKITYHHLEQSLGKGRRTPPFEDEAIANALWSSRPAWHSENLPLSIHQFSDSFSSAYYSGQHRQMLSGSKASSRSTARAMTARRMTKRLPSEPVDHQIMTSQWTSTVDFRGTKRRRAVRGRTPPKICASIPILLTFRARTPRTVGGATRAGTILESPAAASFKRCSSLFSKRNSPHTTQAVLGPTTSQLRVSSLAQTAPGTSAPPPRTSAGSAASTPPLTFTSRTASARGRETPPRPSRTKRTRHTCVSPPTSSSSR